jgi:hypothetical protein
MALQVFEHPIQHTGSAPALHAHVHRMPGTVVLGKCPLFAAIGRYIEDGVEHLQVVQPDVAMLARQQILDLLELVTIELHTRQRAANPRMQVFQVGT